MLAAGLVRLLRVKLLNKIRVKKNHLFTIGVAKLKENRRFQINDVPVNLEQAATSQRNGAVDNLALGDSSGDGLLVIRPVHTA